MDYILHILIFICIYTILAVSLDLLAGHTGILTVAHAAFYGIGAYTSAILAVSAKMPFLVGVVVGMATAAIISVIIAVPSLRLRDDYFVIATFGFQLIILNLFNNLVEITNGPFGITAIPQPSIAGINIESNVSFVILAAIFAITIYMAVARLTASPFGRVLRAIRESDVFAQSLGKNTFRFKVIAFALSTALAASAGSLYAHYITYIDPSSFTVTESILVISMVIIGGAGSHWGPLIGAVLLVILPEALRFIGLSSSVAANSRQMIYGLLLVVMMLFHPKGLAGHYRPK